MSTSSQSTATGTPSVWLRRYSKLVCLATLCLIFFGGQVTSHSAGLAVPDWPTTYGENPITFAVSKWTGGIFYEHFHRLFAGVVATLTVILAGWLYWREPRPGLRELGFLAVCAVLLQAVLGGMTVIFKLPWYISGAHALLAQTFFLITLITAYGLSRERDRRAAAIAGGNIESPTPVRTAAYVLIALLYVQLAVGALMRHTDSGLAIPDFPTTAGRWLPVVNSDSVAWVNNWRFEHQSDAAGAHLAEVQLPNLWVHLAHRAGACLVLAQVIVVFTIARRYRGVAPALWRTAQFVTGIVALQITLGILTIWTAKSPLIASAHVVIGASMLGVATLLALRARPLPVNATESAFPAAQARAASA